MASFTAQITAGPLTATIVWRDGKLVSKGWASMRLKIHAEMMTGEIVPYVPNRAFYTVRNHLRSPYSTVEIMIKLWDVIREIEWIDLEDIEAPPAADFFPS